MHCRVRRQATAIFDSTTAKAIRSRLPPFNGGPAHPPTADIARAHDDIFVGAESMWTASKDIRCSPVHFTSWRPRASARSLANGQPPSPTIDSRHAAPPNPTHPQQVARLLALAAEFLRTGRPADAVVPLREAALLEPFTPIIQHDLGLACLEIGRVSDAIAAFQRAVASSPRYTTAAAGFLHAVEYAIRSWDFERHHGAWDRPAGRVYAPAGPILPRFCARA
jgi:hypothetical protein